nr:hypothetical protein, 11.2K - Agrobacterium tumefaciens insertion sequence IS1131 [Agrobacterium tumefaciens]
MARMEIMSGTERRRRGRTRRTSGYWRNVMNPVLALVRWRAGMTFILARSACGEVVQLCGSTHGVPSSGNHGGGWRKSGVFDGNEAGDRRDIAAERSVPEGSC